MKCLISIKRLRRLGNTFMLLLLSCALAACTHNQTTNKTNEKGKRIKTESHKTYSLKEVNGKYEREHTEEHINRYDKSGNIIEMKSHYLFNDTIHWTKMKYDDKGNFEETLNYTADGSVKSKTISTHHNDMKKEFMTYNGDGILIERQIDLYDENGNLTESSEYTADGKLIERLVFKGNGDECPHEGLTYNSNNVLKYRVVLENCNELGLAEKSVMYDPNGSIIMINTTKYDAKGYLVDSEAQHTEKGSIKIKYDRQFDNEGKLIKVTAYTIKDGKEVPFQESIYEYTYYQ